jgi:hypothetical protein
MRRDRLGVSERWAWRVVGQHRSTQRYEPALAADELALRGALRAFAAARPRRGYRRAHHQLRQGGLGDQPQPCAARLAPGAPARAGQAAQAPARPATGRPGARSSPPRRMTCALDLPADQTADGRPLRLLNIVDEHTRQALGVRPTKSLRSGG